MKKKWFLFTLILFLLSAGNGFAHTKIESSTPENGAIIKDELKEITLTFATKIEQGSTFELHTADDTAIPIQNISIAENVMVGKLTEPLENGQFNVNWNIIGADGHIMDGEFSFTVDQVTEEQNEETPAETEDENQGEPLVKKENEQDTTENKVATNTEESTSIVVPIIIGLLLVIIVACVVLIAKRKK